jgi:lipid-binding SYLF domain-containing protein
VRSLVRGIVLAASLAACGSPAPASPSHLEVPPARREAIVRLETASRVLGELRATADSFVPRAVAEGARCVVVVPDLVHAGFIVGARAGRGVATCREGGGWSRPTFVRLTSASAGLQAGVQTVDVVMLMMTSSSVQRLLEGKAQLGATTSIAAGPVGREAQASSDVTLSAEVLYYSRASGLFVGLDLSGTVLEADEESGRAFYGDSRDFRALLRVPPEPPPAAKDFIDAVERSFPTVVRGP